MTVIMAYPRQISSEEAGGIAAEFFNASGTNHNIPSKPVKIKSMVGGADSSPYYVSNAADNNGFVIVAGYDRSPHKNTSER